MTNIVGNLDKIQMECKHFVNKMSDFSFKNDKLKYVPEFFFLMRIIWELIFLFFNGIPDFRGRARPIFKDLWSKP